MMLTNRDYAEKWDRYMVPNYGRPAITLIRGEGSFVWDVEGNKYLDLLGGIAVSSLGHAHKKIISAISEQVNQIIHTSNLYAHPKGIELAEKLSTLFGSDSKVFFCQDGATANEAALKLARQHGYALAPDGSKQVIVAMVNGFHGRTSGALAITGNAAKREPFAPFGYEVRFVDYNDIESLNRAMNSDVAGLIVEPLQGEGGMNIGTREFLTRCQELCALNNALFIIDEVQSGIGRTGSFFNFNSLGLDPDVVSLAKGIAGGMPLGALIAKSAVAKIFSPGDHGSTFGGNPVSVAAALVVLEEISEPSFLKAVSEKSIWLKQQIENIETERIVEVRSSGLWFGIELQTDSADGIASEMMKRGFLVNAVKPNTIRLAPPLNVSIEDLETFAIAFKQVITA